jgi:hypothetical protein
MMLPRRAALAGTAVLAALGAAGLVGCPPSLDDPGVFETMCPAGFSVDGLLQQTCTHTGCHESGSLAAAGLDLASPGAFARMYGKTSAACGQPLISSNGPGQSLLIAKLEGTAPCGSRMPLGGTPLSASQVACIQAWITDEIASSGPPPPADAGNDALALADSGDASDDASGEVDGGDGGDDGDDGASPDAAGDGGPQDAGDAG